jgi:hypothetical protein
MDQNKLLIEPRHQGVPSGSSNTISEPKVCLAQTVHLSCIQTDCNEIPHDPHYVGVSSGASKMISEHIVCSAQTMHLPCVNISTIFKRTETSFQLSLEPRSTIGCVHNDFWAYGMFGANRAHILHPNGLKWHSTWPTSCRSSIRCVQNNFWAYGMFGANRAPILHHD